MKASFLLVLQAIFLYINTHGQSSDSLLVFESGNLVTSSQIKNLTGDTEYCIKTKDRRVFWLDGLFCRIIVSHSADGNIEFQNQFYVSPFTQEIFQEYGTFKSNLQDSAGYVMFHSCSFNINGTLNWEKRGIVFELFSEDRNNLVKEIKTQSKTIKKHCNRRHDSVDIITLRVFYVKAFMLLISGIGDNDIKDVFRSNSIRDASRHYADEFNMFTSVLYELGIIKSGDGAVLRPRCQNI